MPEDADKDLVQHLANGIAEHLQSLLDAGENPGHVADAALAAGVSLRLQVSGPVILSKQLSGLAQRAAVDAVVAWGVRQHKKSHPPTAH